MVSPNLFFNFKNVKCSLFNIFNSVRALLHLIHQSSNRCMPSQFSFLLFFVTEFFLDFFDVKATASTIIIFILKIFRLSFHQIDIFRMGDFATYIWKLIHPLQSHAHFSFSLSVFVRGHCLQNTLLKHVVILNFGFEDRSFVQILKCEINFVNLEFFDDVQGLALVIDFTLNLSLKHMQKLHNSINWHRTIRRNMNQITKLHFLFF